MGGRRDYRQGRGDEVMTWFNLFKLGDYVEWSGARENTYIVRKLLRKTREYRIEQYGDFKKFHVVAESELTKRTPLPEV